MEGDKKMAEEKQRHDTRLRELKEESDRQIELRCLVAQREAEAHSAERLQAAAREEALNEELRKLRAQLVRDDSIVHRDGSNLTLFCNRPNQLTFLPPYDLR